MPLPGGGGEEEERVEWRGEEHWVASSIIDEKCILNGDGGCEELGVFVLKVTIMFLLISFFLTFTSLYWGIYGGTVVRHVTSNLISCVP